MPQKIAVVNASTVLKDSDIQAVLPALQKQVSNDFSPAWGVDAELSFVPSGTPPSMIATDAWQLIILDNSDQAGALGYHDLTSNGLPLGKVFAGTDIQYGNSWSVTISHELLEMLADPDINLCAMVDNKLYAYEVCDPVEADDMGYSVDGVKVSNFVLPAWFCHNIPGPYDFCRHLDASLELAEGGYISMMTIWSGGWKQINAEMTEPARRPPVGSRRERRMAGHDSLERSTK